MAHIAQPPLAPFPKHGSPTMGGSEPSSASTKLEVAAAVAAPRIPTPPPVSNGGVSLDRYRAKLEECAELHQQLDKLSQTHEVTQLRLQCSQEDAAHLRQAVLRLETVLQYRTKELVLLREGGRGGGGGGGAGVSGAGTLEREDHRMQPPAETSTRSLALTFGMRAGHEAVDAPEVTAQRPKDPTSSPDLLSTQSSANTSATTAATPADQTVMLEYITACCYLGCPTHPQLIQGLFSASTQGVLVAAQPPLTYTQSSVLSQLLSLTSSGAPLTPLSSLYAFRTWASQHLRTLSIAFEDDYAGVNAINEVLQHGLPSLMHLEVRCLRSDAAATKLAETLCAATHICALSLPELAIGDEGLRELWRLQRTRGSLQVAVGAATPISNMCAPLELRTLDLSSCLVKDISTLTQLYCPSVEVLLLPPTDCLTDSLLAELLQRCPHLQTLDVSGCTRLTDACVPHLNKFAPTLRVLAMEHCPHVHRLQLDYVEVFLSSLAHVCQLASRSLSLLPLPVQQRAVLLSLETPQLKLLSLHGLHIDAEVLQRFDDRAATAAALAALSPSRGTQEKEGEEDQKKTAEGIAMLSSVTFSECTFVSDDVLRRFLATQTDLQHLRLYHCRGLSATCWTEPPVKGRALSTLESLHTLELVNMRTLTDDGLCAILRLCPSLQYLNLHGAGWTNLTDIGVRRLDQLAELRVLNLLALNPDLVTAPVVTAMVRRLPHLQCLYHETAITTAESPSRSTDETAQEIAGITTVPAAVVVERSDPEARWRAALRDYPLRLLRLQHHSALALWTDTALPAGPRAGDGQPTTRYDLLGRCAPSRAVEWAMLSGANAVAAASSWTDAVAAAVTPSKLFPAMAARTVSAAVAASLVTASKLPPMAEPVASHGHHRLLPPQQRSPPSQQDKDGCGEASSPLPSPESAVRDEEMRLEQVNVEEGEERTEAGHSDHLPYNLLDQPHSPLSSSSSSSSSFDHEGSGGGPQSETGGTRRLLVQCANAAAAAAIGGNSGGLYPRRPHRRAPDARPTVAAAVAAAAAQTRAPDVITATTAVASIGPWEE